MDFINKFKEAFSNKAIRLNTLEIDRKYEIVGWKRSQRSTDLQYSQVCVRQITASSKCSFAKDTAMSLQTMTFGYEHEGPHHYI